MAEFPEHSHPVAADCRRCPALVESRNRIAWGTGPADPSEAKFLVVGEAPAAGDPDAARWRGGNRTGMAYTSRHSGRRIRDLLADAGVAPEQCFFTNAVKCHPPGNRDPADDELATCRGHLDAELEMVDPDAIVPTGSHATRSVLTTADVELDGFLDAVLDPIEHSDLGLPVVPLLHPSYQDVWLGRLGYTPEEYRDAIAETLNRLG